jgi:hypothetical protein
MSVQAKERNPGMGSVDLTEQATDNRGLIVLISCQMCRILDTEIILDFIHLPYPKNRLHNTDLFSMPVFLPEHSLLRQHHA